jgi:predicted transcriptional regulator
MNARNEALISIHPRHAHAILDGVKSIELRRRVPKLSVGARLWIYATRPLGAVIGTATVEQVVRGTPEDIWLRFGHQAGLMRSEYDTYFKGANEAIGLILVDVQRSLKCVGIEDLREIRRGFHPPQVLTWISSGEAQALSMLSR